MPDNLGSSDSSKGIKPISKPTPNENHTLPGDARPFTFHLVFIEI